MCKQNKEKEESLSIEIVKKLVEYFPETGKFYRLGRASLFIRNKEDVGSPTSHGYLKIKINGSDFLAHRLAWFYTYGAWPSGVVDHRNGDGTDNRIENLRDVPHRTNMQNKSKYKRKNPILPTGVEVARWGTDGSPIAYRAQWQDWDGTRKRSPSFNIKKLGEVEAMEKAVAYRELRITEQIKKGAEYTARHGK